MLSILVIVSLLAAAHGVPVQVMGWSGRIIGGRNATIEEYPYQVSLYFQGELLCGGSIISKHHVLTAAHCVLPEEFFRDVEIRAGSSTPSGGSVHHVAAVAVHERHETSTFGNPQYDVAVLRVKEPFKLDKSRQVIEMYGPTEKTLVGDRAVITGWGETGYGFPNQLQVVELPIISTELCDYAYREWGHLGEGQICAALYGVGGKDSCAGDSGGPLAINGRLAGIVSYGVDCADPKYPGVYASVAHFRDWIDQHMMD